ncbi:MAG: RdgB/HAM1 family non-canonical purine NTP pyrophosphatase [Acidimicrobiia bacterium]
MIERLVVASKNSDKIAEIEAVLVASGATGEIVRGLDWPDVDETEDTLEGNALLKARAVHRATGLPALADDTGLFVDALGGLPGVITARFAGPRATYDDNVKLLLATLGDQFDRTATFRSVVALVGSGEDLVAEGELKGVIINAPRGDNGFGYDPVFEVDGSTLAELSDEEKNQISHRARALQALVEML